MTMMDRRDTEMFAYTPAPVLVDRDPDGALRMSARTTHDGLQRVGHRAMEIAHAMLADGVDVDEIMVEVTVQNL